MPQSNVVFAFIAVAFLIFITARGELPKYAQVFVGGSGDGDAEATGAPAANVPAKSEMGKAADRLDTVFKRATGGKLGLYGGPITDLGNFILDGIDGK